MPTLYIAVIKFMLPVYHINILISVKITGSRIVTVSF